MDNYLTVKQFADAANVTTQRIYQLLAKDLQSYCKEENGRKYIHIEALQRFDTEDLQSACKAFTKSLPSNLQEVAKDLQAENSKLQSELDVLKAENNSLRDKIADRDKTIDILQSQISDFKADKQYLKDKLDDITTALTAAQALHGIEKKQAVIELKEEPQQKSADDLTEEQQELNFLQRLRNLFIHRG